MIRVTRPGVGLTGGGGGGGGGVQCLAQGWQGRGHRSGIRMTSICVLRVPG